MGAVARISFGSTVLVTSDHIDVIVPNADLIAREPTNWTQINRKVRFPVPVGVACRADPDLLSPHLLDIALQFRLRYGTESDNDQPTLLQSRLSGNPPDSEVPRTQARTGPTRCDPTALGGLRGRRRGSTSGPRRRSTRRRFRWTCGRC